MMLSEHLYQLWWHARKEAIRRRQEKQFKRDMEKGTGNENKGR